MCMDICTDMCIDTHWMGVRMDVCREMFVDMRSQAFDTREIIIAADFNGVRAINPSA